MDDLAAALAGSFEISSDPNKVSAPHPRFAQFKSKSSKSDQNNRRRELLENQKKNRFDFLNHVRKLTEDDWKNEEEEEEEEEGMDVDGKIKRPGRFYKDQLMLSEWLVEVPPDLAEEWLMVLCPVGRRTLVVTNKFSTKAYSKGGHFIRSFPSHLPGGKRRQSQSKNCTVLDCVYNELEKTFYVLDLMCWNGHSIYETETEFRFFWLHDKFQEIPELGETSKTNPLKFVPLPSFPCTPESITNAVTSANFEIDGLLFYHKRTHYLFGSSPLVVWLKPYMLPEILNIQVPDQQMTHRPEAYTTYADHLQAVGDDKTKDTSTTKRDYKAYGQTRLPRRKGKARDQEMADASLEDGGEGQGEGLDDSVDKNSSGVVDHDSAASGSDAHGGGGDMESEAGSNPQR
ncbi:snurportin-1-like [Littorina saxatilis]|uniref:Snurportin-1 n=1 Tax=Littorina saxatilis TaxID=31220 RepID=A0AAN9C2P2_9CAEN